MALFKSFLRLLVYPVTRPIRDIRRSAQGIQRAVEDTKSKRARREEDAQLAQEALKGKTAQEKFRQSEEQFRQGRESRSQTVRVGEVVSQRLAIGPVVPAGNQSLIDQSAGGIKAAFEASQQAGREIDFLIDKIVLVRKDQPGAAKGSAPEPKAAPKKKP